MAYTGISIPIPLGRGGLHTDDTQNTIPPTDLILANNIRLWSNSVERDGGTRRCIQSIPIPSGVQAAFHFFPEPGTRNSSRVVVLGGNGKVYSIKIEDFVATGDPIVDAYTVNEVIQYVTSTSYTAVLDASRGARCRFILGGAEQAGNAYKLFLLTGLNKVQVIRLEAGTAAGLGRYDLTTPSADWATYFPTNGFVHKSRLWLFGNSNDSSGLYGSQISSTGTVDHENFVGASTSETVQLSVSPGDGEALVNGWLYKGKVILSKRPFGLFYIDDSDPKETTWQIANIQNGVGGASENGGVQVLDDFLFKNTAGSISSLQATANFGDVESGDTLSILRIEQYIRDEFETSGYATAHSLYYGERKVAMFTYRSSESTHENRMLCFTVGVGQNPLATINTKDQPTCLAMYRDSDNIDRPMYGAADGYLYFMDQDDRNVKGASYLSEFQTPYIDFSFYDASTGLKRVNNIGSKNKNFDFLELRYESTGSFDLFADVFVDGDFVETVTFPMDGDAQYAGDRAAADDFVMDYAVGEDATTIASTNFDPTTSGLNSSTLSQNVQKVLRKRIHGMGRSISVRIYTDVLNQNFKISTMTFSFRVSGEQESKS